MEAANKFHQPVHQPVLLAETLKALHIVQSGIYVDATFGRGGHTRAILARLNEEGRVIGIDRDPEAAIEGEKLSMEDARFTFVKARFSEIERVLDSLNIDEVDGILLDLGISSPQIDNAERGFSFRFDGPLDMRMDPTEGESAAAFLARAEESMIVKVLKDYGEERFAPQIARAIVTTRGEHPILRTRQLVQIIESRVGTIVKGDRLQSPSTRVFQALRIAVNEELKELRKTLPQAVAKLKIGGRLAVISFHSLEDRVAKEFMSKHSRPFGGNDALRDLPIREAALPIPMLRVISRAIQASEEETAINPRSRSAILRVAEKRGEPKVLPIEITSNASVSTREDAKAMEA